MVRLTSSLRPSSNSLTNSGVHLGPFGLVGSIGWSFVGVGSLGVISTTLAFNLTRYSWSTWLFESNLSVDINPLLTSS